MYTIDLLRQMPLLTPIYQKQSKFPLSSPSFSPHFVPQHQEYGVNTLPTSPPTITRRQKTDTQ
jgi:hypothetical protein